MNRRTLITTALAVALIVLTGACNKSGSSNGGGGSASGSLSPTETVKAYYEASNKKDIAGIKKYLSKPTMDLMELGAKKMGKNLDDALKDSLASSPQANMTPTFSNEKITGDTATVDVSAQGQTISMPLVKEGGEWKLAIDKLLQNMGGQLGGANPGGPEMEPGHDGNSSNDHDDHK